MSKRIDQVYLGDMLDGNVNYNIVWSVAVEEIPKLIRSIDSILPSAP